MKKLEKLYEVAQKEKIDIHWVDLKDIGCLGLNIEKEGLPHMIFLDPSIKNNSLTHLKVLAEELGHYFTTVGNFINNIKNYSELLRLNKCEDKATKWACEFLVTEKEIIEVINKGITCPYEMAYSLEVDTEVLIKRLEYLSFKKDLIHLGNNRYLVLNNLPNFYIYEFASIK